MMLMVVCDQVRPAGGDTQGRVQHAGPADVCIQVCPVLVSPAETAPAGRGGEGFLRAAPGGT